MDPCFSPAQWQQKHRKSFRSSQSNVVNPHVAALICVPGRLTMRAHICFSAARSRLRSVAVFPTPPTSWSRNGVSRSRRPSAGASWSLEVEQTPHGLFESWKRATDWKSASERPLGRAGEGGDDAVVQICMEGKKIGDGLTMEAQKWSGWSNCLLLSLTRFTIFLSK